MESLYDLQQRAAELKGKTDIESITPEDTFALQEDALEYMGGIEKNADALGIRKIYTTASLMIADESPIGTNGKALRFGQLAIVYDSSNLTQAESGNLYAYQGNGWILIGNINKLELPNIIDNCNSDDASAILSARQGKLLKAENDLQSQSIADNNHEINNNKERINANFESIGILQTKVAELELGSGSYYIRGWDPTNLNPQAESEYGDRSIPDSLFRVWLIDTTQNTGETVRPVGELKKNNWLRFVDGTFAPTIGITAAMKAECDVALYLDAAHTQLYSAAGAFDAVSFYSQYGAGTKLYNSDGDEVRILRPWETVETKYTIGIGSIDGLWVLDGLGDTGKYWKGISRKEIIWDGVKSVYLAPTAISPGPITTIGGKARNFFFTYDAGDANCKSAKGANSLSSMFTFGGRTYPHTIDLSQISNKNYARANNVDPTKSYPFAEGGFFALHSAIIGLECSNGTNYLHNPALFASGISSNDPCNSESDFLSHGGLKYRKIGDTAYSYCSYNQQPNIYIDASGHKTDASNLLNSYYPKEQCLESQMALSFCEEISLNPGDEFTFYDHIYKYADASEFTPEDDGEMNAIVYKQMTFNIQGYDSAGNATDYELITNLRMSLFEGLNLSGDIWAYWGGGYEEVGTCTNTAQGHHGDKVDIYLQTDQKKWLNETDVSKTNLGIFDFENQYPKIWSGITLGDSFVKTRIPLTPWKSVNGGSISTGQCFYQFENNYWSNVINSRFRLAAFFRGNANNGVCSPRSMSADNACSDTSPNRGGSAQVLIG
jgi:hypothetical protein